MSQYAIISDIHANLGSLAAVLAAMDQMAIDRIVCLGDLVGYYTDPNDCVAMIRRRGILCVRGNHDTVAAGLREPVDFTETARRAIRWTREQLADENRHYLASLPIVQIIDDRFVLVHAALHPQPNDEVRIRTEADARQTLQMLAERGTPRICFFGHTHKPAAYSMCEGQVATLAPDAIDLDDRSLYLINPGSVGQSRGKDPRASFVVYDAAEGTIRFHRVAHDHAMAERRAVRAGLVYRPNVLVRSIDWLGAVRKKVLP